MNRELDVRVAEVLGWTKASCWDGNCYAWQLVDDKMKEWVLQIEYWRPFEEGDPRDADGQWDSSLPHYSTDIAVSRTMEDWIEANGDPGRYGKALHDVALDDWGFRAGKETTGDDYLRYLDGLFWRIAHATPEQRCRAFLAAMEAT